MMNKDTASFTEPMMIRMMCEPRSMHLFLLAVALGLLSLGGYATYWGLRQPDIDTGAIYAGAAFLLPGVIISGLWIWLVRRLPRHYLDVDSSARKLRLFLGGELHSERSWYECGKLWVQPVSRQSNAGDGHAWWRYDLWMEGFYRPLFIAGNRDATEQRARLLAKACGLYFDSMKLESRDELREQRLQNERVRELGEAGDEEAILEHLDPRIGAFDLGRKTAQVVNGTAVAILASHGTVDSVERLMAFGDRYYAGNTAMQSTVEEAVRQMQERVHEQTRSEKDEFSSEECATLVFYAVVDDTVEPDASCPSLVMRDLKPDQERKLFVADVAPNLTMLNEADFMEMLTGAYSAAAGDAELIRHVQRVETWARANRLPWYLYELEPPAIAGDGRARRFV